MFQNFDFHNIVKNHGNWGGGNSSISLSKLILSFSLFSKPLCFENFFSFAIYSYINRLDWVISHTKEWKVITYVYMRSRNVKFNVHTYPKKFSGRNADLIGSWFVFDRLSTIVKLSTSIDRKCHMYK